MMAAIVPAKALDQAKSRLAKLLSEKERRDLALAMLEDVLRSLRCVARLETVVVVSPDDGALDLARRLGAEPVVEQPSVRGINQALDQVVDYLAPRGIEAVLVLPADVPGAGPGDIEVVLDALPPERGMVICPSARKGTGALALRPLGLIPFRFGPDSFTLHRREAAARGIPMRVLRIDSLSNDIDEPPDLQSFWQRGGGEATRRLLLDSGLAARLGV